jgi:signal transduction histidine kinase
VISTFYSRSIRHKLIVLFTATASFTVLIACASLWVYQLFNYRATLQTEEGATAQLIADSSGPALLFGDGTAASETLSILRADKRIEVACLYDRKGQALAAFSQLNAVVACPAQGTVAPLFSYRKLVILRSIEVKGEPVGTLYLQVGLAEMYRLLNQLALTGACVLVITTVLAMGLSSLLERLISRPIIHLTEVATKVSLGGNYLVRAQHTSDDETGVLIDRFNVMMDYILERENELQNARTGLEDRIKERTSDLRNEIVERKAIERDLVSAKQLADQSNQAKSSFLASMSHELRTPLNAIIGYSEMLHEEASENGSTTMIADLNKVLLSARHLLTLISDILDFSKIEAGQMKLFPEVVLSSDILADVLATAGVLAHANRNQIVVADSIWCGTMLVDALRFRQCLLNLIGNACKFTTDGVITIAVAQRCEEKQSWIDWSVSDSGVGIPAEEQQRLFQVFSQVDSSATRKQGGSGLGLAITQQLCHAMGGYIVVNSVVNRGSTFTLCLPDEAMLIDCL